LEIAERGKFRQSPDSFTSRFFLQLFYQLGRSESDRRAKSRLAAEKFAANINSEAVTNAPTNAETPSQLRFDMAQRFVHLSSLGKKHS
jgi:hypothetical protein